MKVISAFAQVFAIFSLLTLGSLMMIVALHILTVDQAVLRLQEIYRSPWLSVRTGFVGLMFILVGLSFAKTLVKHGRQTDALIIRGENGPMVMPMTMIEDVIKKVIKKFHLVKEVKIKASLRGKALEVKLRLVLWSGGRVPDLLAELQDEVRTRIYKVLGEDIPTELICDVQRIEEHEMALVSDDEVDAREAVVLR
mgnify:CR=1 FL=1